LRLLEIDFEVADLDERFGRGGAAEDCAETGEQLVDSERLRHVVVGARVESRDLLLLLADHGEDEHRGVAPPTQLTADLDAAFAGQNEIQDDAVRGAHRRLGERVLAGGRRLDVVTGGAQHGLEGTQDLRLVVDDEDPRTAHGEGTERINDEPPSRLGSASSVAPLA